MSYFEHLAVCTGCQLPIDEFPDTFGEWAVLDKTIMCPAGNPTCAGHMLEYLLFCPACQQAGTHPALRGRKDT